MEKFTQPRGPVRKMMRLALVAAALLVSTCGRWASVSAEREGDNEAVAAKATGQLEEMERRFTEEVVDEMERTLPPGLCLEYRKAAEYWTYRWCNR